MSQVQILPVTSENLLSEYMVSTVQPKHRKPCSLSPFSFILFVSVLLPK